MPSQPKVLIVDDEERFRTTMCKLPDRKGLGGINCRQRQRSPGKAARHAHDIVVLDIMPEMGGVHALSEMKKIDPQIEVIIMTGYASVDTAKEIIKLGAFDYLLKPYAIEELIERIEQHTTAKTERALKAKSSQDS